MPVWKEYLSFSKKERTGVLVLVALVLLVGVMPYFYRPKKSMTGLTFLPEESKQIREDSVSNKTSSYLKITDDREQEQKHDAVLMERRSDGHLFKFDPNTLSTEAWKKLGLRDRTIRTIQNYLSKGGKFHKAEDLKKVYGLHDEEYNRLSPFVVIKANDPVDHGGNDHYPERNNIKNSEQNPPVININNADSTEWIALPGIGSKLANRIIHFRDKLGGFYSIEQIGETFGLHDSVFRKISNLLYCDQKVKKININSALPDQFTRHPYLNWNLANAIVNYRTQHGNFKSLNELLEIQIITADILKKISPYFTIE